MKRSTPIAAALAAAASLLLTGCSAPAVGGRDLTQQERQQGDRMSEIGKSSGGDWGKLNQSDKDFMLKMSYGNEQSAKMLLLSAAGKIGGGQAPGRPAQGGPPGSPGGPPGTRR